MCHLRFPAKTCYHTSLGIMHHIQRNYSTTKRITAEFFQANGNNSFTKRLKRSFWSTRPLFCFPEDDGVAFNTKDVALKIEHKNL